MAAKAVNGDGNISEKKRSRIEALEQRLSTAASGKLPAALSARLESQAQQQGKRKKKKGLGKMEHSNPAISTRLRSQSQKQEKHQNKKAMEKMACSKPASVTRNFAQTSLSSSQHSKFLDGEANDPAYFKLCQPIHENLLGTHVQTSEETEGDPISGVLHDLLRNSDQTAKDAAGEMDKKIQDKYLPLDNPTSWRRHAYTKTRRKALCSLGKRSQKHMSMRQHRHCGSFDIPKKYQKYNLYFPMHEMWKEYMVNLLKNGRQKNFQYFFLRADLHGAILAVVESKNKSFIGIQGIMIRETVNTFGMLTSENKFRVVPKKGSVFMFQVEFWQVIIHGDNFSSRNVNQE